MKLVLPGGSGHLGRLLAGHLLAHGHEVVVLSRGARGPARTVPWDGRSPGAWCAELEGADAVVNLAGRSVNCRYTPANLKQMLDSRVESTRAVGQAIERAQRPPRVWLQMSTATIYAHGFDTAHDDVTGRLGGDEAGVPDAWKTSIDIAKRWEAEQELTPTPRTRKLALRTAMVMWPGSGGPFATLLGLTRAGLGGPLAGGRQFISWIHGLDFAGAVLWLIERDTLSGPVNLAAPGPLPQREFARQLRAAAGARLALPATRWMLAAGAVLLRTDTELVLKSRRVVPRRMLEAGFDFAFPEWAPAARDLVSRDRARRVSPSPSAPPAHRASAANRP